MYTASQKLVFGLIRRIIKKFLMKLFYNQRLSFSLLTQTGKARLRFVFGIIEACHSYITVWGDYMKFAKITYFNEETGAIKSLLNSFFKPFEAEKINIFGAEGYDIRICIDKNSNESIRKRVMKRIQKFLDDEGVVAITGEYIRGKYFSKGQIVTALLSGSMIKESDEAVIIGGDKMLTEIVLCAVCPKVRSISLLTDELWEYDFYNKYFFDEYGINIQMISTARHENFLNSDVIVNCGRRTESYFPKKGCIYYDILDDETRQRRLYGRCRIIKKVSISGIDSEISECALYVLDEEFKRLADGYYNEEEKLIKSVDKLLKVVYNF